MTASNLLAFAAASMALLIVPGPSVVFVITRGVSLGRRAALLTVAGNVLAVLSITLLVVFGLGAMLDAVPLAFEVVKWSGAAYLVYLGIRTLLDRNAINFDTETADTDTRRLMTQGFMTTLLNPKLAIFFAAFLPQFVQPEAGNITGQLLLLGLIFATLALVNDSAYALLAGSAGERLKRSTRAITVLRWASGITFIGLGARLAFDTQH